jgi:hypothetical protein
VSHDINKDLKGRAKDARRWRLHAHARWDVSPGDAGELRSSNQEQERCDKKLIVKRVDLHRRPPALGVRFRTYLSVRSVTYRTELAGIGRYRCSVAVLPVRDG